MQGTLPRVAQPRHVASLRALRRPRPCYAALGNSRAAHLHIEDGFLDTEAAVALRSEYEERFSDPMTTRADAFCWNMWHVPGQYTQLRTPAADFFSAEAYGQLEEALLSHGRRRLGCSALSPLWLSLYISGCKQEMHADLPHGPWALVLSLSPPERRFLGGQTVLLQPHVLDYWRTFSATEVVQATELLTRIEPEFNRLTLFDARYPHAVSELSGTMDPLEGRLVINGWYLSPTPFFEGPMEEEAATDALNVALAPCFEALAEAPRAMGLLAVRLTVVEGSIQGIEALSDTLVPHPGSGLEPEEARAVLLDIIADALMGAGGFPVLFTESHITMPFEFA